MQPILVMVALVGCGSDPASSTFTPSAPTDTGPSITNIGEQLDASASLFDAVDPFIGTGGQVAQVTGVSPGASAPNGLTLIAPDTRSTSLGAPAWLHLGGYHYDDDLISGFAHTRGHGIGIHDYGAIQIQPRASWDPTYTDAQARSAPFVHEAEGARPGSYEVTFQDDGTDVAIVATLHGAHHVYRFAQGTSPTVVLDLGHEPGDVDVADAWADVDLEGGTLEGFQRIDGGYSARFGGLMNHVAMRFDPAPVSVGGWLDPSAPQDGLASVEGEASGVWLTFPEGTEEVHVRVGLSYVDVGGAWANLDEELPDLDQEARRAEVEAAWRERIDGVQVLGGSEDERAIFATALYHTLLMPSRQDDVDSRYRGIDGQIHVTNHPYYSDMSLWDTFRTLHPWYLLAWPDLQLDTLRSLERMVDDGGALPRWPMAHGPTGGMVGTPAAQVLAESYLKGMTTGWDVPQMWAAAVATSTGPQPYADRRGIESYMELGYVPLEESGGSASRSLEYAWSDHALSLWGKALNVDTSAIDGHAGGWEESWDASTSFFRARSRDGSFLPLDNEFVWVDDYIEGNAWHYVWYVPYDVDGMIALQHGGDREAFLERLSAYWDEVEAEPDDNLPDQWYWHGNEPVLHYAALGSLAGDPALSARAASWVAEHRYSATPTGLDGNDDAGTLSAWYLWSALGVYPIAGTDRYAVLSPRFDAVRIRRDDGDILVTGPATPDQATVPHVGLRPIEGGELVHTDLLEGLTFKPVE